MDNISKGILFISFNEKNNMYNNSSDLLKYIKKKNPVMIIICTQNSNPNNKSNFQNYFLNQMDKNNYSVMFKLNYCLEMTKMVQLNAGCKNNLRTRIYIKKYNNINETSILNVINEKTYSIVKLRITYDKNTYLLNLCNGIDFDVSMLDNFNSTIIVANLSNNKKIINKNNVYYPNSNINNNLINNFGESIINYTHFINNLIKKNQNGGASCFTENNKNKLQNKLSYANNIPNEPGEIGYYTILNQLIISGITKNNLICLLNGIYEEHNDKNKTESLVVFLGKFVEYLENKNSKNSKKLLLLVNDVYRDILQSYKDTIILTNISIETEEYKDFYIDGNYMVTLFIEKKLMH